jgi:hypothetical protein
LHKYQTPTASAWPIPVNMVSREHSLTAAFDRPPTRYPVAAVEIFRP